MNLLGKSSALCRKRLADRHVVAHSHFSMLHHRKRDVHFDAKISNTAFKLSVTEKYLYCSDVFQFPIAQRSLGPKHRISVTLAFTMCEY